MTRPKAISRAKKLLALAADRAATEPEKKLAKQRADELIERFQISLAELTNPPRRIIHPPEPVWAPFTNTTGTTTTTTATSGWFAGNRGFFVP